MKIADLITESSVPKPQRNHLLDAIHHADTESDGWGLEDFELNYLGLLSVDQLSDYDDVYSWIDVAGENDLEDFRDGSFADVKGELPPVIVIVSPDEDGCREQIGDGRGRINYAHATGTKLHTYQLTHKHCK